VASTYVVTKEIKKAEGGTVKVTAAESKDLAGTRLDVPAGALGADTTITVAFQREAIAPTAEAAGPVAEFGPAGTTFSTPATLTLPFKLAGTQKAANLYVQVLEDDGTSPRDGTVDAASRHQRQVAHFTRYQPRSSRAAPPTPGAPADEACVAASARRRACAPRAWTGPATPTPSPPRCGATARTTAPAPAATASSSTPRASARRPPAPPTRPAPRAWPCVDGACVKKTAAPRAWTRPATATTWPPRSGPLQRRGHLHLHAGFEVEAASGKCQPVACAAHADCAVGQLCVGGRCEYGCAPANDLRRVRVDLQSNLSTAAPAATPASPALVCWAGVCTGSVPAPPTPTASPARPAFSGQCSALP
jgi:hypothetical protein